MFNKKYVIDTLVEILEVDSPTGFTKKAMDLVQLKVEELGFTMTYSNKGNGIVEVKGIDNSKVVGVLSHIDTLGLMVRSINDDGTLNFTTLGGILLPTVDSEYCKVYTSDGKVYSGTVISNSPSAHVYKDSRSLERNKENMHIRLDENVKTKEDVLKLNIGNGDFICIDTKTVVVNDFIKSRFLDDKACVAIVLGMLKHIKEEKVKLKNDVKFIFSTYEEVGHGSSHIPEDISECLALDMGCIGKDLSCTEEDVSICAKDGGGPYDYDMVNKLKSFAKEDKLNYAVDIYEFYSSDVTAGLRGGNDIKGALIGPGIHASHGLERTHYKGIENTMKLLLSYLTK